MSRNDSIWKSIDWWTILMWFLMVIFGWLNIFGTTSTINDIDDIFKPSTIAGKQFIWICIATVMAVILVLIDHQTYEIIAYLIYGVWIIVLLITPFLGREVKGTHSLIQLGSFSLQPAEFAKCFTALALAKYMSRYEFKLRSWRDLVVPVTIILIPMIIIMVWEQETGSALVFAAFFLVLYREGMSGYVLLLGTAAIVFFVVVIKFSNVVLPWGVGNLGIIIAMALLMAITLIFTLFKFNLKKETLILLISIVTLYAISFIINIWIPVAFDLISTIIAGLTALYIGVIALILRNRQALLLMLFIIGSIAYCYSCNIAFNKVLKDHQRKRIEVILKIKEDAMGVEYNTRQAKIAIGSGGLTGKGFGKGTQTQLKYVPEQHTDFILTTVGEEFGFVGTMTVIIIYLAFILRLIYLAERQKDMFSQIFGYSVACIFMIHVIINIGMVIGLLPVIGIPLPFYSYGGSSLIGFTLMLFIFLKLDAARVLKL